MSIVLGIDVGSTTVKAVVVDPTQKKILWSDYQRHQTKQPEMVLEFIQRIAKEFAHIPQGEWRVFMTGSGSGPICEHVGAKFVQEVNAVTLAVETLHPEVGSVVELGGQDAKIIIFKEAKDGGGKTAMTSMNDKCASGTGATIDKCMIKVGLPQDVVAKIPWDDSKIHHVAAKCGVFAETDIVNLVKSGIPSNEIMCSLADAIVMQNLSVLTRGNTLRAKVLLLGGPNTYLPFLKACWRQRIPETWRERGYKWDESLPIEELIITPKNSELYAAYGAVLYGLYEPAAVGMFTGLEGLESFISVGRKSKLGESAGPPLSRSSAELSAFTDLYKIPSWTPPEIIPGSVVEGVIGLDGGSTSSKAVLIGMDGALIKKEYQLSKGNPIQDTKEILGRLQAYVESCGATLVVKGFGATGYAADVLESSVKSDVNVVETVAHMMSAVHFFGDVDVICDIGGQDIKVLFMSNGDIRNFRLSNQCSAGNGMLLQAMADQFGLPVTAYAETAFKADLAPKFSYGCAVFLDSDRVNFQKEGYSKEELLAGLAQVLPKNVWQYVVQIPRMAALGRKFVLQGGTQYNLAAVKAQVDYIKERVPDCEVYVHPHTGEAGAIGAAMETLRVVKRRGTSTFIGMQAAINLEFESINDESTRCHFCENNCARTFIDTKTPDGDTARYISGFSCEKGTVESEEAMLALTKDRKVLMKKFPNLVDYEAKKLYAHFYDPPDMPSAESFLDDVELKRGFLGKVSRVPIRRKFRRSSEDSWNQRARIRVGVPKILNVWTYAPFFRTYLESLGIQRHHVVFSDDTSEEMWIEGGKYGSIDPCFPSKVGQAHIHNLLFKHHKEEKKLAYIFFPCITHVTTELEGLMDVTSCPIVAGAPNVIKAAFTKEVDFFAERGIKYLDPALPFNEPTLMKKRLFECFGPLLGVTEDESDFAVDHGYKALDVLDADLQKRGRAILDQVEKENRVALLMIGRPYHSDPGMNHSVLEEFQVLGYPVLSMRSLPRDRAYLDKYFKSDVDAGRSPLDIGDVWPENYSANSATKVWAAKFASRHPHVVVLDLSSFKCGHDAPTYGIIDGIITKSATPYQALHDIDANKPGGSIKIRVKTYSHALKLHEERLDDAARKQHELAYRMDQKRAELLELKQAQLEARKAQDPTLATQLEEVRSRLAVYEGERQKRLAEEALKIKKASAGPPPKGLVQLGVKRGEGIERLAAPADNSAEA
jgi:activator of 2-hydroxyglutaryl-CoA dehydratase/predicted nucleotide-binding protein (sugar kinase/HSP70/actin superfamily)